MLVFQVFAAWWGENNLIWADRNFEGPLDSCVVQISLFVASKLG